MNILLINHYAGSLEMGMEYRPYYMAREWVKAGHQVTILAGDYSHLRSRNPRVEKDFTEELIDGITYCWIKTGAYEGNGAKRAITMARFVSKIWLKAKWIVRKYRPNAIITSSTYPLDTYAGQRLRRLANRSGGVILLHEIHDMWPITPMEMGGMSKFHPFIAVMQLAENSFCRHSDRVVSLLPAAKQYLMRHGMAEEKFVSIPNGIVLEEWQKQKSLPEACQQQLDRWKEQGKFVICFFGSHTKSYALEYLIDAVTRLKNEQICALFVGDGMDKENLRQYAEGLGAPVCFMPPVKKSCIPSLLANVDGIYVGIKKNRMSRFGICMNKLFDAMMSAKPIVYAIEAPNNYIEEFQCGISVKSENALALAEGIMQLQKKTEEERIEMGQRGRKAVIEHFNYQVLAQQFLTVIQEGKL